MLIVAIIIVVLVGIYFGKDYLFKSENQPNKNDTNNSQENNNQNDNQNNNNNQQQNNTDNSNVKPSSDAFLLAIEDVFTITGRGTVVTGKVERGSVKVGDEIEILGLGAKKRAVISSIEMFREMKDVAETGDNAGLLLKDISRDEVERGQVLAKPDSIGVYTKFKADIYVLLKEEGGRSTPFFTEYRPQLYFRTTDITGTITLPSGIEMAMPGDNVKNIMVELISNAAMEKGTEFTIRESGRTIGKGTVTEVMN